MDRTSDGKKQATPKQSAPVGPGAATRPKPMEGRGLSQNKNGSEGGNSGNAGKTRKRARSAARESIAGADESTLASQLVGLVRKYSIFLLLSSA